jgi:hypothetical protein
VPQIGEKKLYENYKAGQKSHRKIIGKKQLRKLGDNFYHITV